MHLEAMTTHHVYLFVFLIEQCSEAFTEISIIFFKEYDAWNIFANLGKQIDVSSDCAGKVVCKDNRYSIKNGFMFR